VKSGMCFDYLVLTEVCMIVEIDPNSNSS